MDWNHEVSTSLLWLVKAFFITVIIFSVTCFTLARTTKWGRQIADIAWPYFCPKRSKKPLATVALLLLFTLFSVRMNVLFSFWYNGFYNALQKVDAKAFWLFLAIFSVLATIHVVRALLYYYLQQSFQIRWRVWLNERFLGRWTKEQAYFRTQYLAEDADNPDQRIQQDINTFTDSTMTLSLGLVDAVVSLIEFTTILWGLSGALHLFGTDIPRAMVFLVYIYVFIATLLAIRIGRPLVKLNFLNEQLSANYRYALIRLREYGESVAFFKGEKIERGILDNRFFAVIANAWEIVFRSIKFQGFNLTISQAAVVFPFIVQAPRFLSKQISLGDVMQTSQAFGQVQDALSFIRTSYDSFANYRAVINRLTGFSRAINAADRLPTADIEIGEKLETRHLCVLSPTEETMLTDLNLSVGKGESLLIKGKSGSGKTTLLRSLAGLWPFASGHVVIPEADKRLFLSQKAYMPLGSLKMGLCYPLAEEAFSDAEICDVLQKVQLGHLGKRITEEEDWTRILSLGEQQRLAFGRALLSKPEAIFLDEATSAMDEGLEDAMYSMLRSELPNTLIVSVGHRSTLIAHHQYSLVLEGKGSWRLQENS
ncbi:ABC transporter ATP-binding protein/permease [Leeia sp. TBRC 13508]|uniref:ABC transporter ATP-binding protein/permease n=1 Tax=Leeia speluncae TaxID=2884804 RepID=A0ABS8D2X4_9NEIS|nr:ABC transporter ATP-binding protein/permease [Leeia speluncae]MCB6182524.1 ABC transporter ATP-binding protein/permease [Leeia speluncae]